MVVQPQTAPRGRHGAPHPRFCPAGTGRIHLFNPHLADSLGIPWFSLSPLVIAFQQDSRCQRAWASVASLNLFLSHAGFRVVSAFGSIAHPLCGRCAAGWGTWVQSLLPPPTQHLPGEKEAAGPGQCKLQAECGVGGGNRINHCKALRRASRLGRDTEQINKDFPEHEGINQAWRKAWGWRQRHCSWGD